MKGWPFRDRLGYLLRGGPCSPVVLPGEIQAYAVGECPSVGSAWVIWKFERRERWICSKNDEDAPTRLGFEGSLKLRGRFPDHNSP